MRTRNLVVASAAVCLLLVGAVVAPGAVRPKDASPRSARLIAATRTTSTADGRGYWLVNADGRVFAFGGAHLYGSMAGKRLKAPITGIVATVDRRGYWLVAADGGVFSFGDAEFAGSLGGNLFASPIVGMASSETSSSPPGPEGPAGPAGATGADGTGANSGAVGTTGATGAAGATGLNGSPGIAGPTGVTGVTGAIGATGPIGATGATGSAAAIVGSACTKGAAAGTITQDIDSSTGVVTFICATLVMSNALISGGWGIVTGSGLMPGNTLSACWNQNPGCTPSSPAVASDGTTDSAPGGAIAPCGTGITGLYFEGFTTAGDPIESNRVNAGC
jgi:hypothetical protein